VNDDGYIRGGFVSVAPQIAWLLDNYLSIALTPKTPQAQALQAAIWHLREPNLSLPGNTFYTEMIGALGPDPSLRTGDVSRYAWMTPKPGVNQGLITSVPDGGVTLMLLGGALVGLETLRRKLRV
jgi:hypothetical protein